MKVVRQPGPIAVNPVAEHFVSKLASERDDLLGKLGVSGTVRRMEPPPLGANADEDFHAILKGWRERFGRNNRPFSDDDVRYFFGQGIVYFIRRLHAAGIEQSELSKIFLLGIDVQFEVWPKEKKEGD